MIKGDVDLTENLDFYRDKKPKELPSIIPWKTGEVDNFKTTSISITFTDSIYNDDWTLSWHNMTEMYNDSDLTISYNNSRNYHFTTTSNYYYRTWTSNTISDNTTVKIIYDDYSTTKSNLLPFKGKPLKNIVSTIFNKKNNNININRLLPWYNKYDDHRRQYLFMNDEEHNVPWDKCTKLQDNKPKQALCPWLGKLNSRIYDDYIKDLEEEQDYSSYLTNMSWLRIH